jgi:hypothetical protein
MIVENDLAVEYQPTLGATVFLFSMVLEVVGIKIPIDALPTSRDCTADRPVFHNGRVGFQLRERPEFHPTSIMIAHQGKMAGSLASCTV